MVLTSMPEHARLAHAALKAGKHVLVEKPVATSLEDAEAVLAAAEAAPGISLRPARRALADLPGDACEKVRTARSAASVGRARYGWAGPGWGKWYYEQGGGALFDLGVYNVTSLCGFFGAAKSVTAMTGVAIPKREVQGERVSGKARTTRTS